MELEQLRVIWKTASPQTGGIQAPDEVMAIAKKSSQSPLARMKRNLFIECFAVIVLYGSVATFYFIAFGGQWNVIAWLYLGIGLLYLVYFYRKYALLSDMQCPACQVRRNLEIRVRMLEKYIRFYLLAGTLMIFLVLWFFWAVFVFRIPGIGSRFYFMPSPTRSIWVAGFYWFIITTIITTVMYFVNRWYIDSLYGNPIKKLRELLIQMDEDGRNG